jgi:pimeloyl-ACP methyl ester carboxylesterase
VIAVAGPSDCQLRTLPGVAADMRDTEIRTLDGLRLSGTLVLPPDPVGAVVLVHGGGVTREEGGFFARLAEGLAEVALVSLRFDLRGHGTSEGRQEDLTLSGVLTDIRSAMTHVRETTGVESVDLLGASFAGGICAYFTTEHHEVVRRLVLINPLVNYKKRFIDDKPYWHDDWIDDDAGRELLDQGFVLHNPTLKLGRPLLNEVFYLRPHEAMDRVSVPTLIVHGTKDTFIPIESSRQLAQMIPGPVRLVEVEGAQHGIAVDKDPLYLHPQTQEWQASVVMSVAEWLSNPYV